MTFGLLPRAFYRRPVTAVAPALLGCVLVRDSPRGRVAVEIVEVEAYAGGGDPASHAFRGRTDRNAVMFGPPGHVYVYFTYGMHYCLNLVCQPAGEAAAVLVRAGRVVDGLDLAAARRAARQVTRPDSARSAAGERAGSLSARAQRHLASGPARLCQSLGVDREQDGADACDPGSQVRVLAPAGFAGLPSARIACGPRVGVRDGHEVSWRFWVAGDASVSAYRAHAPRRRGRS